MNDLTLRYEETGEYRPPLAGEWFQGYRGPIQARFDFTAQEFKILREIVEPKEQPDAN